MGIELLAVLRRPLQPLGWHQQRAWHRAATAQARQQFAGPVRREQCRPAEVQHVADDLPSSRPARDARVQRFENLVGHHAADFNDSDVPLYRRHCAGCLKRPSFLCHHHRRSIVTGPHRSERGASLPCDTCCRRSGSMNEPVHFSAGSAREPAHIRA